MWIGLYCVKEKSNYSSIDIIMSFYTFLGEEALEWARIAAETDPDAERRKLAEEAPDAINSILAAAKAAD